jgi:hypothetical protein
VAASGRSQSSRTESVVDPRADALDVESISIVEHVPGTVAGTCGGQDISGQKVYGNSVYVRQGGAWKWVFGFNSPS